MIRPGPKPTHLVAAAELAAAPDFGSLFRLGLWGAAAGASLLLVAIATRTEVGQSRMASANNPPQERQVSGRDTEADTRRLTETIRNLAEDRDRLLARMTALERNYEDVTGSIGKLATAAKPPAARPPAAEPQAQPQPAPSPPQPPAEIAPVATLPAAAPPPPAASPAAAAPAAAPAPAAAAPDVPAEAVPARTEFGVDIGGAPSMAALRVAWDRNRRNHASLLDGLRPVVAIRETRTGQVDLRLVVGPIGNAAAAAKLCASLAAAGLSCQPTLFDGQRLALR